MSTFRTALLTIALVVGLVSPSFALNEHAEKTLQSAVVATADGSALSVEGYSTVGLELTLAGSATVTFEGSMSGVNWTAIPCISAGSITAVSPTATASGLWQCQVAGLTAVRARISSWTSGAVTVFARATTGQGFANVGQYDANGNLVITKGYQDGGEHIGENQNEELGYMRTVGGKARSYALMTDVTTNTSSATAVLPVGGKTFFAKIAGTGAQSVTVTIWGDYKSTATEAFPICTMSLSGTSEDAKKCTGMTEDYDFYHAKTASITGTSATVNVWSMMGLGGGAGSGGGAGDASAANQTTMITALQIIDNIVSGTGVNVSQVNGVTPLMGAGATGTGSPRTTEANDSQLSADIALIKTAVQLIDDDQTGASTNYHVSVGTTEDETEIKATAGRLMGIQITNVNAAVRYFRCANLTAANTVPGTSAVFYGVAVPGATTGAGLVANFGPSGLAFSTALTCWLTTGAADTDVAEVAANDLKWNIQYK